MLEAFKPQIVTNSDMNLGHIIMGLSAAAILGIATTQDNPFAKTSTEYASIDASAQKFIVSDDKHYFEYSLSPERKVMRGIAT